MSHTPDPTPHQPDADDIRGVLMPVSLLLLAVGMFDGGLILYSAWAGKAYTSNAYVFALGGAIFLAKGSLFTVRIAMVAAAFFLSAILGSAAGSVLQMPGALVGVWLTHAPAEVALSALRTGGLALIMAWILKRLIHPIVLQALVNDGMKLVNYWKRPVAGFMLGFLVPLASGASFAAMQGSDLGKQAVAEARKQAQPGEEIYLRNLQPAPSSDSYTRIEAQVVAYTSQSLRKLAVTWDAPMPFRSDTGAVPAGLPAAGSDTTATGH